MTVIFVVPVFGVLWGALFLDEAIHLATVLGGAVILLSVWLITRSPAPARRGSRRLASADDGTRRGAARDASFGPMNHRGSPRCGGGRR